MTDVRFLQHRALQHSGGTLCCDAARGRRQRDCRRALDAVLAVLSVVFGQEPRAASWRKRAWVICLTAPHSAAVRKVPIFIATALPTTRRWRGSRIFRPGSIGWSPMRSAASQRMAAHGRLCLMCAEREPLDCHRCLLVARALAARGFTIGHILYDGTVERIPPPNAGLLELEADRWRPLCNWTERANSGSVSTPRPRRCVPGQAEPKARTAGRDDREQRADDATSLSCRSGLACRRPRSRGGAGHPRRRRRRTPTRSIRRRPARSIRSRCRRSPIRMRRRRRPRNCSAAR